MGFFRALANIAPTGHAATPSPLESGPWDRCQKMPQHFYFRQEPGLIVLTSAPLAQGPRRGGGVGQNADFLNLPAPSWPRPASNADVPHVKRKAATRAFRGCPWNSSRSHPAGVATSGKSSKKAQVISMGEIAFAANPNPGKSAVSKRVLKLAPRNYFSHKLEM